MGTHCAPFIADLFLVCYERDFMTNLHKSNQQDLIDMLHYTSRYLDNIFTIDNPEFEKQISVFIHAFTTNAMTSDFLLSISSGCVVMFLDSHCTVFTFLSWFDLLCVVRTSLISILKIFEILPNCWRKVTDITSTKDILKVLQVILWAFIQIWWNIVSRICFWRNLSPVLLRWSSPQTKKGQMRSEFRLTVLENS